MKLFIVFLSIFVCFNILAEEKVKSLKISNKRQMTKEQVAYTLERAGFPREIVPVVTCLAEKESNFNPNAVNIQNINNSKDHGLLQINDIWMKTCNLNASDLSNPLKNAKCALKVYKKQGLTAWVTYNKFKRTCLDYEIPNYNSKNIAEIIIKNNELM